jgi:hypothetical protein
MRAPESPRRTGAALAVASVLVTGGCTAAGTAPAPSSHSVSPRTALGASRQLAARYLRIAEAGNRRLEVDFDRLHTQDRRDLAAARADLRDAAATERLFDRRLLAIPFPPAIEAVARTLFRLNEARARLTAASAASASLPQLREYEQLLAGANVGVERAVRLIRRRLGLPPPETS